MRYYRAEEVTAALGITYRQLQYGRKRGLFPGYVAGRRCPERALFIAYGAMRIRRQRRSTKLALQVARFLDATLPTDGFEQEYTLTVQTARRYPVLGLIRGRIIAWTGSLHLPTDTVILNAVLERLPPEEKSPQ